MFKVTNKLNRDAFINLSEQLSSNLDKVIQSNEAIIDLKGIIFSDPFGIVGLILFTRFLYNEYRIKSIIQMPTKMDVQLYLLNAGITKDEGSITSFDGINNNKYFNLLLNKLTLLNPENSNVNFIPITDIVFPNDIDIINKRLDEWMLNNNFKEEERNDLQVLVSEICQNINQHSETLQNGIFLMQGYTYKSLGNEKRCIISIGDSGIGIKGSLDKNKLYADLLKGDDNHTINMVLKNGWSSQGNEGFRGNGFFNLQRLSQKHNLNFYIHSHGGILCNTYIQSNSGNKKRTKYNIYPIKGTQISFELKAKKII